MADASKTDLMSLEINDTTQLREIDFMWLEINDMIQYRKGVSILEYLCTLEDPELENLQKELERAQDSVRAALRERVFKVSFTYKPRSLSVGAEAHIANTLRELMVYHSMNGDVSELQVIRGKKPTEG